jgi:hypothetical protein
MKRIIIYVFVVLFISSSLLFSQSAIVIRDFIEMKYDTSLQKVVYVYDKIKTLYTVLEKLQPIAIAENNNFYILKICQSIFRAFRCTR